MAKQKKCYLCEAYLDKTSVGLNRKLLGLEVSRFFCLCCLANYLDVSVELLLEKAQEFKEQGCELF